MSTRYNTGNPIESTDVRDMSDNAKNLDLFSNSSELSFDDRFGVERKTIHGMNSEFDGMIVGMNSEFDAQILNMGFTRVGTFLSGATLTNPRQTLLWDIADGGDGQEYGWSGAFPLTGKVVPPGSTPLTTGGIAVGAWMSRFDPELRIQVREALRRSYAEAGYNLADGSFEAGGTLVNANDVLLHEASGKTFSGPAGAVAAGTNPASGGFVDKSGVATSASAISNANGGSVQDFIDAQYTTVAELATGKFQVGQYVRLTDRAMGLFLVQSVATTNGHSIIDAGNSNTAVLVEQPILSINVLGSTYTQAQFDVADTINSTFDLLGASYALTALPKGNYFNGEFVIGVNRHVFPQNDSKEFSGASFNLKRAYSDSRYTAEVVPALKGSTVILGDSISHGAYQGALYDNGWVNLFKRMVNAENGYSANGSYGLIPLLGWNTPDKNNTVDLAQITLRNNPLAVFTIEGEQLLNALAFEITPTATVKSILPTFQATVRVWYVQHTGGGTIEVIVNGVSVLTQDTSGALNLAANLTVPMTDNGLGQHTIEVRASVGVVTFSGFGYEISGNVVNNFAQSGRKLIDATPECLRQLCTGANLIMALGHNDVGVVEGNPVNQALFTTNINRIIANCLKYNTNVIVPDFCWFSSEDTYVRKELKRLARETKGIYVDMPSLLTRDYRNKSEFGAEFYLVNTLRMWRDASHPNELGGQWIAETIAKAIGLGCTTKSEAMSLHDFSMPLRLTGTDLVNRFDSFPNLTTCRRNGNSYTYNIRLKKVVSGGGVPIGEYTINTTGQLPITEISNGLLFGNATLRQDTGAVVSKYCIDQQGVIKLFVDAVYLGTQEFSLSRIAM